MPNDKLELGPISLDIFLQLRKSNKILQETTSKSKRTDEINQETKRKSERLEKTKEKQKQKIQSLEMQLEREKTAKKLEHEKRVRAEKKLKVLEEKKEQQEKEQAPTKTNLKRSHPTKKAKSVKKHEISDDEDDNNTPQPKIRKTTPSSDISQHPDLLSLNSIPTRALAGFLGEFIAQQFLNSHQQLHSYELQQAPPAIQYCGVCGQHLNYAGRCMNGHQ